MSYDRTAAQRTASPPPAAAVDSFTVAQALFSQGRWSAAEPLCRAILERQAGHPGALTLLGIIMAQTRRSAEAAELLGRVARGNPTDPGAQVNHGNVLRDLGQYPRALSCFERALALQPDSVDAHYNRGLTLTDLGRYVEAIESYDRALALKADHVAAWNNRGAVLHRMQRHGEALASLDRALAIAPNHSDALGNRGAALHKLERYEEALASLDRALAIEPRRADTHFNHGVTLRKLERFEEALSSLRRAVEISPRHAAAHSQRGVILRTIRRFDEALASHEHALAIDPHYAEGHFDKGVTLVAMKRLEDALLCFEQALRLDRRDVAAHRYVGSVRQELKQFETAIACYEQALALDPHTPFLLGECRHARMNVCNWSGMAADLDTLTEAIERGEAVVPPFVLLSLMDSPALQRKAAEVCARRLSPRAALPPLSRAPKHEKIRIGYFSADLRDHPVSMLAAELFETHDRSRFELTAFSLGPDVRDAMRARVEGAFDCFLQLDERSDHDVARLARQMEIDIAVDLGGYTRDSRSRILALRAAPIQVSYLGYLGTMGGDFIDYLIADAVLVPPESRHHYSEKIAYLPSYQVNDSRRPRPAGQVTRAELGLPATGFVFCCFNNTYKITPETFGSWMRILAAVPDSVLFLLGSSTATERNLRHEAAERGIAPERLVFGGTLPMAQYLARYRAADLFLDTLPYNAGTTASDALWAGLPVLTLAGQAFAARMAASILTAAGLPELMVSSREDYERQAVRLATDPQRLASLRQRLAQTRATCALFDTPGVARNLETLYEQMYARHRAGAPPEHILAAPGLER